MQRPAGEVRKDRVKRTPTELRLRRDALQGQEYFGFMRDLENLIGTQPAQMPLPVGSEPSMVAAITQKENQSGRRKKEPHESQCGSLVLRWLGILMKKAGRSLHD